MLDEFLESKMQEYERFNNVWKLGYKTFGPFLYGFCNWLHENVEKNHIQKIYFFSRDGYIIKKAYEILYGPNDNYKYFYLSRRSLMLPSMKNLNKYNDIIDSIIIPPSFTIDILLKVLGLHINEKNIYEIYNIKKDTVFYRNNYFQDDRIKNIIMDNYEKLEKNIEDENKIFLDYMKQENMNGDIAIVDIGWHNSIQSLLSKIMTDEYKGNIYGFYVGVYNNSKKLPCNHSTYGYLYDENNINDLQYKTFSFVSLFESMFLSSEGTTIGYDRKNGYVVPVTSNYEYENKPELVELITCFQEGALKFCSDAIVNDIKIKNKEESYKRLIDLGLKPTKEEIKIFSNLEFENYTNNNLINFNHCSFYYFFHLRELKNDFYRSGWRILFLKKLIPIPFPHFFLFKILCKLFIK